MFSTEFVETFLEANSMLKFLSLYSNDIASFLVLNLDNKRALITIKLGFMISDGWNEKPRNLIHLLAPFVSGKKIIVDKDKNKETHAI